MNHTVERHRQTPTHDFRQLMNARTGKERQESNAAEEKGGSGHIATHRNVAFLAGIRFPFLCCRFCLAVLTFSHVPAPSTAVRSCRVIPKIPVQTTKRYRAMPGLRPGV